MNAHNVYHPGLDGWTLALFVIQVAWIIRSLITHHPRVYQLARIIATVFIGWLNHEWLNVLLGVCS